MNYDQKFAQMDLRIKNLQTDLRELKAEFKNSKRFTNEFLQECYKRGIKRVSIGKRDDKIKACEGWSFGHSGSVFADARLKERYMENGEIKEREGWPAIWAVVKKMGISGGCGNEGQHQINDKGQSLLIEGSYQFKGGKWYRQEVKI